MCKWLLNGDNDGVAMTLTTAHHFAGNIMYPRQGYREMGVLDGAYGDYERPVLWFLARTIKAGKLDSCVMEVYAL